MSRRRNRSQRQYSEKENPNIAVVVQNQGVGTPAMMPRNMRAYIQEGYRSSKTVFRVVGHIARAGAGIKWKHYTDKSKQKEISSANDELMALWDKPAPKTSGSQFREAMIAYYCLTGNSYVLGINTSQSPAAKFDELYNLRPDLTKIKADANGPVYYEFGNFTPPKRYPDPFVMHNKLFAGNDDLYGMSPVEVAAMLVDIQKAGQKWNLGLLNNMARPGGAWVTDALLGDQEYTSLKREIKAKFGGPRNAGETAILHGGVKWQSMSMSPMELDWIESDNKSDRDIAGIFFNFPLFLLGLADSTYSNQEEARYALYTEIELPLLDMFEGSLNMWLTPRYGGYLGYDPKDIEAIQKRLQEAQGLASDRATAEFTASTTTFHEAREIQGKKPLPVKDFVIINMVPVHVEDLDDYIAALTGEKINPPAPPPMLPPPTTITEIPDDSTDTLDNSDSNGSNAPAHQPNSSGNGKNLLSLPSRRAVKVLDLHTADEKAAYMKSVESQRTKWEKTIKGRLEDYFSDEHKTIASAVTRGSQTDATANVEHALLVLEQQGTLKNLIVSLYQDVGTDSGESVIKDLKYGEKPFEQKQIALDFNLYSPDVLVYLLSLAGTKVQQIDSTTLALLISELADGVEAGESIAQLSQRVDDLYLSEIIPNRSQVISSTEVVAASNYGSQEAAKASDLSLDKVWLATNDGHTRPDHREADGQTVGMDEPFEVGGEQLMYPGDISLGAGADQIVNCFPGDTEVVARGIQAATKRWYEGELVEITTSLGHKLAGTPNHPILTNRGWIGLGSLKEGDSVVSGRFAQEMPLSNPYIKNTPTEIGKVFDAISRFEPGERVSGSHVDFHGDGSNADVEIVFPYSLLRNTVDDASFRKPLDKELLPISDFGQVSLFGKRLSDTPFLGCQHSFSSGVRCTCERNSLVTVGLAHAQVHTFGAIAGSDTGNLQMPGNHMAGNIEPACNSFDGHTALKESNSLVSDIGMAGMSSSNALILEDSASGILNPGIGGAVRDVENISNVVEAFPGLVQLTGITKVIRRAFSGHVYNLQTKSNWYISNGIISHNCRCTTYYQQAPDSSLDETDIGKALAQVARSFPQVAPTRDQYRELLRAKR